MTATSRFARIELSNGADIAHDTGEIERLLLLHTIQRKTKQNALLAGAAAPSQDDRWLLLIQPGHA